MLGVLLGGPGGVLISGDGSELALCMDPVSLSESLTIANGSTPKFSRIS